MAQSIHIAGATTIKWGNVTLGQTDENDDINIEIVEGEKKIYTNASGPIIPAKIIDLGIIANITIPLISYDDTVLDAVVGRANTAGTTGTLGGDVSLVQLDIIPTTTGQFQYTFALSRCKGPAVVTKWGIEALRWVLNIEAIPANSNGTYSNQTLYTKTAV